MQSKYLWPAVAIVCASIIGTGAYFGLRSGHRDAPPSVEADSQGGDSVKQAPASDANDPVVYATRTGECYHRSSCSSLRSSRIPMKLSEARSRYRPCSRCSPPR